MHAIRLTGTASAFLAAVAAAASLLPAVAGAATALPTENAVTAVRVISNGPTVASAAAGSGGFSYGDVASVAGYRALTNASGRRAYSEVALSGVSLLGGLVTADSVKAATYANAETAKASGTFGGAVDNVVVAGVGVAASPGARFDIPNVGYGVVDQRVVMTEPGDATYRAFDLGLDIHVTTAWNDVPAGTEIQLGYADAGATVAPPDRGGQAGAPVTTTAPTQTTETTPTTATQTTPTPDPAPTATTTTTAPTLQQVRSSVATPGNSNLDTGNTTALPLGMESPPPGGFALNPPIDLISKAALLGPEYVFPVAGGAKFSNDFGAPRSDTGWHQGIDLFAPIGTPVLAVTDGTIHAVGWNHIGGHRLWLEDAHGNWFYYAHLSAYAPNDREGVQVHAGDIIAYVGNTGDAQGTPYHLHFEIHPAGKWAVPPYNYVSAWLGRTPGFAASVSSASAPPPPSSAALVALGSYDISGASGLDPTAVARAATLAGGARDATRSAVYGGAPPPTPLAELKRTPPGRPFNLN